MNQVWVLGSGGLLGSEIKRQLQGSSQVWEPEINVPWSTQGEDVKIIRELTKIFFNHVSTGQWIIFWCAGSSAVKGSEKEHAKEFEMLGELLLEITKINPESSGCFFLASSAGGVYGGSQGPPFSELSFTSPINSYGKYKLKQEALVYEWGAKNNHEVVIGRISNIVGVNQNLIKKQGIISQLVQHTLTGYPLQIFVPLDTIRDYIDISDCAAEIIGLVSSRLSGGDSNKIVSPNLICSGKSISIAQAIHLVQDVIGKKTNVIYSGDNSDLSQPRNLSFQSLNERTYNKEYVQLPVSIKRISNAYLRNIIA